MSALENRQDSERGSAKADRDAVVERTAAKIVAALNELIAQNSSCALVDYPNYANVGDSAIWLGIRAYLKERGVKVVYACDYTTYSHEQMSKDLGEDSLILFQGGGNFGDFWPNHQEFRESVIQDFPEHRIVALPQSVNFKDDKRLDRTRNIYNAHSRLTLLLRDSRSLDFCRRTFNAPSLLCPDLAFLLGTLKRFQSPQSKITCLMRRDAESRFDLDKEAHLLSSSDISLADWLVEDPTLIFCNTHLTGQWPPMQKLWKQFYPMRLSTYDSFADLRLVRGLEMLSAGKVVLTDRLHGYILSLLMNIPHVVLDNTDGKVRACYDDWTSDSELTHWADDLTEAVAACRRLLAAAF